MKILTFGLLSVACTQPLIACDFCALYSAMEARTGQGFHAGVAEQFTHYGTLQDEGHKVANAVGQYLDSSIAQLVVGYDFNNRFGTQLNVPLIDRSFKRPEGFEIERGRESGIGDVSLIGRYFAFRRLTEESTVLLDVLGGVKFPSGNTARLKEEFHETEIPNAPESGIHGHDLTLGSGSYDGIVGADFYIRWKRSFWQTSAQYNVRSQGDYGYRFANDFTWSGGPGALLIMENQFTLSLLAAVSGETKGRDTFQDEKAADTGITTVYSGPQFTFSWSEMMSGELGVDVPVFCDNTALQVVPDYRIRAAVSFHF